MCGIFGYIGDRHTGQTIKDALKRLEYRGYDSAGITVKRENQLKTVKTTDGVIDLEAYMGSAGIGHTRWATHGEVNEANAHPHTSCDGRYAIVHNGIIENHKEIKQIMKQEFNQNHEYSSETDSEVIAHWIEQAAKWDSDQVYSTLKDFDEIAEGNYAIVVIDREKDKLFALRNGSPLVVGMGEDENFVGSDLYAFSQYTDKAYFLEDGEIATIKKDSVRAKGGIVEGERFEWTHEEKTLDKHDHWMRQEIDEIPSAIQDYLDSVVGDQSQNLNQIADKLSDSDKVIFTASGSSYHATLLGVYYLQKAGVEAQTLIASEFENYERVDENTTVVAVSQSGETRDVLDAMTYAREQGADIVSLVNVPHSTIQRESDYSLEIRAGQEICVASTKTFINQLVALMSIAQRMGYDIDLANIPEQINEKLGDIEEYVNEFLERYLHNMEDHGLEDIYVIGKGETYPIAREIALKLKEISYIHAEGMMAGELKHGTLALIEQGTNVVTLDGEKDSIEHTIQEVESRNAHQTILRDRSDLPTEIKYSLWGFLASYHIAKEKDLPIDKPRNLAKSVTVK